LRFALYLLGQLYFDRSYRKSRLSQLYCPGFVHSSRGTCGVSLPGARIIVFAFSIFFDFVPHFIVSVLFIRAIIGVNSRGFGEAREGVRLLYVGNSSLAETFSHLLGSISRRKHVAPWGRISERGGFAEFGR